MLLEFDSELEINLSVVKNVENVPTLQNYGLDVKKA